MKLRMKVFAAVALAISLVIAYLIVEEVSTRKTVNLYRPTSAREKLMAELSSLDPSQYGGYYLSDNATKLHINVLSTRNLPIAISGVDNVEIHTAKYSLKQLQDLEETVSLLLQERHEEFNLKGYGVNQTDNKFSVSVVGPPDMDTSELQKLLDAYAMDADMYEIKIEKEHAVLHTGHVDQRKERLRLGAFTRDGAAVVFQTWAFPVLSPVESASCPKNPARSLILERAGIYVEEGTILYSAGASILLTLSSSSSADSLQPSGNSGEQTATSKEISSSGRGPLKSLGSCFGCFFIFHTS